MTVNKLFGISAIMLALSVACGAFAAHGLKDKLDVYYLGVFEKGAFYHLTQSIASFAILFLAVTNILPEAFVSKIFLILMAGIVIFSGSLYLLAILQIKWLGAITPIGGTLIILAWSWLGFKLLSS